MGKAVLISIRPKWVRLIESGKKTIEVRKTRPKISTPFKCYIYQTLPKSGDWNDRDGRVVAEFLCDRIYDIEYEPDEGYNECYSPDGFSDCLTDEEFNEYLRCKNGYGWRISNLVIYDKPRKLTDLYRWYDGVTDIRPCENGKKCDHLIFDYSEDHEACGIDYDGENCPFLKVMRPPQSWCYVEEM